MRRIGPSSAPIGEPGSRWYREATASGQVALLADGQRIEARLAPATDPASVRSVLGGAARQVRPCVAGLRGMLADENLPTTLELLPVD